MATPTTTNLPTRQQLDEIDALLRRMLTLPPVAGESAEPAPVPPPAAPANLTFPTPVVREVPPAQPPVPGDPVVQAWRVGWQPPAAQPPPPSPPSVAAWGSPVTSPAQAPPWVAVPPAPAAPPQLPYAMPVTAVPAAPPAPTVPAPVPAPAPGAARPSESLLVLLLLLLNGTFNLLTYLFGPIGTWLRGPGRGAMGWAGAFMVVAAAVWAVGNWYGYDWPKPNLSRLGISR